MGQIFLPEGVGPQDYQGWIENTPEGREYSERMARAAAGGYSVSHAPPAEQIRTWLARRPPGHGHGHAKHGRSTMLWQPSPQYQNMPHDQYMKTAEGQRATQAFADWGNWVRNNVQHQQQSGAPSSQPAAPARPAVPARQVPDMSAYSPTRTAKPSNPGGGIRGPASTSPPVQPPAWSNPISNSARPSAATPIPTQSQGTRYGAMPPVDPNVANTPNVPRPQPFSTQVHGFDGRTYSDPAAFFSQRDAFIQRLNEERSRQSVQSGVYGQNERPEFYRPSRDFPALWGQAGDMVANGWTNPLLARLFG